MFNLEKNVKIRPFDEGKDYPDALKCFNEGFNHILWPFIDHAEPDFHRDLLRLFYTMSPHSFVAEVDGEVHGLLMGAAPFKLVGITKALLFFLFIMTPKLLANRYKFNLQAYKHLARIAVFGAVPWVVLQPFEWSMSEVNLFTSRKQYRGRGMGRKLMDKFFDMVRENSQAGASVCTDTSVSYWFYEGYGFEQVKKFNQKAYKTILPNETYTGLIYYYALNGDGSRIKR